MNDFNGFQPVNPMANFQQGYSLGDVIRKNAEAKAMRAAEAKRKQSYDDAVDAFMQSGSQADAFKVIEFTPEDQRENVQKAIDNMTVEQKEKAVIDTMGTYNAFLLGEDDIVKEEFLTQARAFRAEDREQEAKQMEALAEQMDDPTLRKTVGLALLNMVSALPGGKEALEARDITVDTQGKQQEQQFNIIKTAQELGLNEEETATAQGAAFLAGDDLIYEMLQYSPVGQGNGEGLTESEKLDLTLKLQDRYYKASGGFKQADLMYNKLLTSAMDDSGQGDLALIFQFMKLLDEGSVVRESEYAQARDTGTLWQSLKNMYDGWTEGHKLQPEQRAAFARLAGEYMRGARKQEEASRADLGYMATNRGLDLGEIFIGAPNDPMMNDDEWAVEQLKSQLKVMLPQAKEEIDSFGSVKELEDNYKPFIDAINAVNVSGTRKSI